MDHAAAAAAAIVAVSAAAAAVARLGLLPIVRLVRWLAQLRRDLDQLRLDLQGDRVEFERMAARNWEEDARMVDTYVHLRRDVDELYVLTGHLRRGPHE